METVTTIWLTISRSNNAKATNGVHYQAIVAIVAVVCRYHPGLAEIIAPVGSQEAMPFLKDSPLKTIAQCRLDQPVSNKVF